MLAPWVRRNPRTIARRQQRSAATLVGSVTLILAAGPAATSAATLTGPPATAPGLVPVQAAPAARAASLTTEPAVYRVARGDYLGEVAERYLDDVGRYPEVARLNRLADPDRIHPGQLLRLPDGAVDDGARRHATGRLVLRPAAPAKPAGPGAGSTVRPDGRSGASADGSTPGATGRTPPARPSPSRTGAPRPTVAESAGAPPAMAAGASRAAADDEGLNRPLAISAVLAVASIVGAQIGALLGLRRRPLGTARHRRD